jgi:hypothetical protein
MQPAPAPRKPDGVDVAVWIMVGLSALLLLGGLGAGGMIVAGGMPPTFGGRRAKSPDETVERMLTSQRHMLEAARMAHATPVGLVCLAMGAAGFVAAFRVHRRRPGAVRWFSRIAIAMIPLDVVTGIQGFIVQRQMQPAMAEFMNSMPRGPNPQQTAPFIDLMTGMFSGFAFMTLVMTIGWSIIKIAGSLYVYHCVRKPAAQAWLASAG